MKNHDRSQRGWLLAITATAFAVTLATYPGVLSDLALWVAAISGGIILFIITAE